MFGPPALITIFLEVLVVSLTPENVLSILHMVLAFGVFRLHKSQR